MDSDIFTDWINKRDRKFAAEHCKVAFIVGNCPAHPEVPGSQFVELLFLPPNTTSITQPMDQGVIRPLNVIYRQIYKVIRKFVSAIETKQYIPK